MASSKDPKRFAGKMGIGTGPVPIGRWKPQPAVNVAAPPDPTKRVTSGESIQQDLRRIRKGRQ